MTVLTAYHALLAAGELRPDPEQAAAAARLDRLAGELQAAPRRGSLLWRLAGRKPQAPRGLYLWGGVGRGKSMLMDLFFDQVAIERKRRVHFSEFMLEVHARINEERRKEVGDPIPPVAAALRDEARLLAFDEMMAGVTVVTTSNRAPADLYKNGLNREHFLPFIALIEQRLDVLALNGPVDYRRDRLGSQDTWLVPNGPEATADLSAAFFRLTDHEVSEPIPSDDLVVQGRTLHVPKALKGVAVFLVQEIVRRGARRGRLPGGGAALSHGDPGRHPAPGTGEPQRGGSASSR
ncbi:hypothetical protein SASPL_155741 [Salvia splendens]|uniref:Cell division protein ZapE n=1 Tax=Salvia splendens TaxID=180675 RepID=A0A8X8VY33_SALSN|nr:hypothetical protein SASPL_155741 [Salvia splendens]